MIGTKQKEETPSNNGLHNALAAGTTVKGNMTAETDFRLDGKVEGDIDCKGKIVIGPKGCVIGNIQAVQAEIHGEVKGKVMAAERLTLKATGIIIGDITTKALEIEPNARFDGSCTMNKQ